MGHDGEWLLQNYVSKSDLCRKILSFDSWFLFFISTLFFFAQGDSIIDKLNRFEETVQQIGGIHKSASELKKSRQQQMQAVQDEVVEPEVPEEQFALPSPQQYGNVASLRQPQQYRTGAVPLTSSNHRSSFNLGASSNTASGGVSSPLPRKASTPNAYGQTNPSRQSPKASTNGYGLREYTPTVGARAPVEQQGAKLGRQASLQIQPISANYYSAGNAYPAPLERASSLSRMPVDEKGTSKPLLSTLMSRPLK